MRIQPGAEMIRQSQRWRRWEERDVSLGNRLRNCGSWYCIDKCVQGHLDPLTYNGSGFIILLDSKMATAFAKQWDWVMPTGRCSSIASLSSLMSCVHRGLQKKLTVCISTGSIWSWVRKIHVPNLWPILQIHKFVARNPGSDLIGIMI